MRTAVGLIVVGLLAFAWLSRDLIAEATGRPFMGITPSLGEGRFGEQVRIENLDLNGIQTVRVETTNGEINVRGPSAATESNSDATATNAFSSDRDAVRITERGNVNATISRNGDRLIIRATSRPVCFGACSVQFDLNLSRAVRLDLQSGNGQISLNGQAEAVKADSSNGEISVIGAGQADVNLQSGNGDIQVENVQGRLEATTSNGQITVQNAQPGSLKLDSGNGDISLTRMRFGDGINEISTSSGTITIQNARNASFGIETSNGEVVLDGVELRAGSDSTVSNSGDDVRISDLSAPDGLRLSGQTSEDLQLPGFTVQIRDGRLVAEREGSNPASLRLETSGGSVRVRP